MQLLTQRPSAPRAQRAARTGYRVDTCERVAVRLPYAPLSLVEELFAAEEPTQALRAILTRKADYLAAIHVASPSLCEALQPWLEGGAPPKNKHALIKATLYVLRMAARSTPFGQFSGIGTVGFGDRTHIQLGPHGFHTRTRPDMTWFESWVATVERDADLALDLPVCVNDLIHERGERLWITNPDHIVRGHDANDYGRSSLVRASGVDFVIEHGPGKTLRELRDRMAQEFEVEPERVARLLAQLRSAGLLLRPLRTVPVGDPVAHVAEILRHTGHELGTKLAATLERVDELDRQPVAQRTPATYRRAEAALRELHDRPGPVLQVDAGCRLTGSIARDLVPDIELLADTLMRSGMIMDPLAQLKERFLRLYEGEESVIPLLELVEADVGPDVPAHKLIRNLEAGAAERHDLMMGILATAMREHATEYALSEAEVDVLLPLPSERNLPDSMEIGFHIVEAHDEVAGPGNHLLFPAGLMGSARATKTLGRFLHLFDDQERASICDLARRSVAGTAAITAELVYVAPDGNAANKSLRPRVLEWELQVGCTRPADGVRRLSPADLYVGLRADRFYLWSRSLDREVRLVESHMLNLGRPPALVRFLTRQADDGVTCPTTLNWGPFSMAPFLPRLTRGRVVLSPARWRVDLHALRAAADPAAALARYCREWKVPAYALMVERDNAIPLCLGSALALEVLLAQPRAARFVELREYPWSHGSSPARSQAGAPHAAEFVVPLRRTAAEAAPARVRPSFASRWDAARPPASEWSYAQLPCSPSQFDALVARCASLSHTLHDAGQVTGWFFLRYSDPSPHVRVRFRAAEGQRVEVRNALFEAFQAMFEERLIHGYSFHTYHREVERYGGPHAMDVVERLFSLNSDRVSAALGRADIQSTRFESSVRSALPLVCAFYRPGAARDWLGVPTIRASLTPGERRLVRALRTDIAGGGAHEEAYAQAAKHLVALAEEGLLVRPLTDVVSSLVHMHFNRFGGGEERGRLVLRTLLAGME